jgi:hypothetical protein
VLGVGAPLHAGEDMDLTTRALLSGYFVHEAPRVEVIRHGFYRWDDRRTVIHRYWYGTGAALVKSLKCGHWSIAMVLVRLAWGWVRRRSCVAAGLGSQPYRLLGMAAFLQGFAAGAVTSVDRAANQYTPRRARTSPTSRVADL